MRMSKMFSRTLREAPNGADTKGYEYLLRAGYIRQMGAGIFSLLPLGFRATQKIQQIIREEMNAIGGEEMQMPVVNPADIWKETGRYYSIDKEMGRFSDRNNRDMVLAMTHEEAVTDIARGEIDSYKRLPLLVYQMQTKWRDDPRPRAGLIRVREFTMLDSYSFDRDAAGLDKVYRDHYRTYFRIFSRCGLPSIAVGADSGMMGGKISHEYMYLSPIGEDTIILCDKCGYTANRQIAKFQKEYLKEEMKAVEKVATPEAKTIEALAEFLKIDPRKTAKCVFMVGTFINDRNGEEEEKLIVALVRGDYEVEESKLSNAARANSIRPAHDEEILACGMVPGYASPIGAKGNFICIVDDSVAESNNLVAGANEAGFHYINTNFGRDYTGARPVKLSGWYKYDPKAINHGSYPGGLINDECNIYVTVWDADGNQIGFGEFVGKEKVDTYQPFSFDIEYSDPTKKAAKLTIVATSSHYGGHFEGSSVTGQVGNGSTLWVDDCEVSYY